MKENNIKKVLLLGSGALKIGEAGERRGKADWADSDRAYDSIVSLTKRYNKIGRAHV